MSRLILSRLFQHNFLSLEQCKTLMQHSQKYSVFLKQSKILQQNIQCSNFCYSPLNFLNNDNSGTTIAATIVGSERHFSRSITAERRGSRRVEGPSITADRRGSSGDERPSSLTQDKSPPKDHNTERLLENSTSPTAPDEAPLSGHTTKSLLENSTSPTGDYADKTQRRLDAWNEGAYPHKSNYEQSQAKYSYRPRKDPAATSIVLFPGQGTQFVGMGRGLLDYPTVQDMYDSASEILGFNLLKACIDGPDSYLAKTQIQQPAILVTSLAAVEKLRHDQPAALEDCVGTAGYSVGEITALTFAGALSFEESVQLIKVRAEAMQLASEMTPGGMMIAFVTAASRLGLCCETAKEYCNKRGVENPECRLACYISPMCKVVAGSEEALHFIKEHQQDFKLKSLRRLYVSGAFHTSHMEPAAQALAEVLPNFTISAPNIPVYSNIDGKPYRDPKQIRKNLPRQICSPVKWEQTMHTIYERHDNMAFPKTFECGPGSSLKSILGMNNRKAKDCTTCIEV